MKNLVMTTAIFMFAFMVSSVAFAQELEEKDVPASLKEAFKKEFPTAKETEWEKEDANYEVEFEMNKIEYSVLFDEKGNKLETEMEIKTKDLPKTVSEYIKANYKGTKIKEAAKITDAKGTITYEAEVKGMDLIFDKEGKFIKEIKNEDKKTEKEEDNDDK